MSDVVQIVSTVVQIGIDVAEGGDQTICAVRIGAKPSMRIETIEAWVERDLMKSVARVQVIAERYGVTPTRDMSAYALGPQEAKGRLVVDAIGVGAGVASRLAEIGYKVTSFKGNEKASPPKNQHAPEFGNKRAEAIYLLRGLMDRGELSFPPDARLAEELHALTSFPSPGNGRLFLEDKKAIREQLGRSPDRADAVCMACWEDPDTYSGFGFMASW